MIIWSCKIILLVVKTRLDFRRVNCLLYVICCKVLIVLFIIFSRINAGDKKGREKNKGMRMKVLFKRPKALEKAIENKC